MTIKKGLDLLKDPTQKNNKVAFDIYCDLSSFTSDKDPGTSGWSYRSLTGVGRMRQLEGAEKVHGLQRVFENQAGHVPATVDEKAAAMVDVLCLDVEVYCGKKANKKECPGLSDVQAGHRR